MKSVLDVKRLKVATAPGQRTPGFVARSYVRPGGGGFFVAGIYARPGHDFVARVCV